MRLPTDVNFLALSSDLLTHSVLGEDGLPVKFRVLPYGASTLTLHGQQGAVNFTREMADTIVGSAEASGNVIPVDLEHALFLLASELGLEEAAFLKLPGENPAAGYVTLTADEDGLWANVKSWVPRAAVLLKEKMYKYFSPVIRGLADGKLRLTSLALTNTPAFDFQEPLVAGANVNQPQQKGKPIMDKFIVAILTLLGLKPDAVALTADGAVPPEGQASILGAIEALKTKAVANPDAVAMKAENAALKSAVEGANRQAVIDKGRADGKLTDAMIASPLLLAMDAAVLTAFLEPIPANSMVPLGTPIAVKALPEPLEIDGQSKQIQKFHSGLGLNKEGKLPGKTG